MGDRAQVLIEDTGVYLYTHWGGRYLPAVVSEALDSDRGRGRWDDPCYLTRIIFSEMIKGEVDKETGYGICTTEHGDVFRLVKVNCEEEQVTVVNHGDVFSMGFEDFASKDIDWEQ